MQVLPPQHGPVSAPQTAQIELLQTVFASLQVLPAQQGLPAVPQVLQMLVEVSQTAPASLQAAVVELVTLQHGWPRPPQISQEYFAVADEYTHWVPASLHVLLLQHGPPFLPQSWQTEALVPVVVVVLAHARS